MIPDVLKAHPSPDSATFVGLVHKIMQNYVAEGTIYKARKTRKIQGVDKASFQQYNGERDKE